MATQQLPLKKTKTTLMNEEVDWEAGLYAGIDTLYPVVFEEFVTVVDYIGREELMIRCKYLINSNSNESAHSKLFRICAKNKFIGLARLLFACQHLMLIQNFGYSEGSFLKCLGTHGSIAQVLTLILIYYL